MLVINPRCDTIENWYKVDPIPVENELCCVKFENGKIKYKLGDGKTHFRKLKYIRYISEIAKMRLYTESIALSGTTFKIVCDINLKP